MDQRSASPTLPAFGIRDLSGPNSGLIKISKRQYESTIKSQPDAKLLYLDDDDGELITVGSGLELSQRLEEPVLRYTRGTFIETRNPIDNELVHVFDIKRSSRSLAEWRDHEAYSSKFFRRRSSSADSSSSASSSRSRPTIFADEIMPAFPKPKDVVSKQPASLVQEEKSQISESLVQETTETETLDIIGGVEKHLTGLATVLQIAADTMQKAAKKTRETDATVVEDILKGVRDILVEVGTFGVEIYKDMNRPVVEDPFTDAATETSAISVKPEDVMSSTCEVQSIITEENARSKPEPVTPSTGSSVSGKSSNDTRVKFAFVEDEVDEPVSSVESIAGSSSTKPICIDESDEDDVSEYSDANPSIVESQIFKRVEPVLTPSIKPSILDDSSEDADFTARYPPLHTVRRARSTIESPTRESFPATQPEMACALPLRQRKIWEDTSCSVSRQNTFEACRKPLPGAWPDVKNDSTSALPVTSESSGAFFNRMTGRTPEKGQPSSFGLHRANTTASSNPASRLNGPFDPGFPYEPKTSHINSRLHRRSLQFRDFSDQLSSRSHQSPATKALARLESKRSVPNFDQLDTGRSIPKFAHSARRGPISLVDARPGDRLKEPGPSFTKFDSHRGVKHRRSVPHFQPYTAPPPPPPARDFSTRTKVRSIRPNWVSQLSMPPPDYLTGSNVPSAPLNSYPVVAPQPYTPPRAPELLPVPQPMPFMPSPLFVPSVTSNSGPRPLHDDVRPSHRMTGTPSDTVPWRKPEEFVREQQSIPSSPSAVSALSSPEAERVKNKFDLCVEQLQMCGFGIDDDNLRDRLHVYAVAANGDVEEAVEMIEEDRRVSDRFE